MFNLASLFFQGDTIPGNTSHITKTLGESSAANYDPTNIFKGILSYASPPLQVTKRSLELIALCLSYTALDRVHFRLIFTPDRGCCYTILQQSEVLR